MPQLPSVSELMVGAHLPSIRTPEHLTRPLMHHHLGTSPRQGQAFVETLPVHRSGPHTPPANDSGSSVQLVLLGPLDAAGVQSHTNPIPHTHALASVSPKAIDSHQPATGMPPAPPASGALTDYFNYRHHAPPPPYSAYARAGSQLLVGDAMPPQVAHALSDQHIRVHSPSSDSPSGYARPRPSLFSHTPSLPAGPPPHFAAYSGPVAPMVLPPTYNPYVPPHAPGAGGSTLVAPPVHFNPGMAPFNYGYPPMGPAIMLHYGAPNLHYGAVMVGPGQARGVSERPARDTDEQNNALINKRRVIKRRTRTGCLTCRKRRIKCDERKPHCSNCERSKKLCLGYELLPGPNKRRSLEQDQQRKPGQRLSVHDLL